MEKTITTHQAEVETFTVKVRVITVNNRKMTLSVFRQLEKRNFVDRDTVETRGEIWGRVNYHWDGCGYGRKHQHIVWQKGESIYRDCFGDISDYRHWGSTNREASYRNTLVFCGAILEALEQEPKFLDDGGDYEIKTPRFWASLGWTTWSELKSCWDYKLKAEAKKAKPNKASEHYARAGEELREKIHKRAKQAWSDWCEERFGAPLGEATLEAIKDEALRVNGVISEKKDKYTEAMKRVEEASHLFIAV